MGFCPTCGCEVTWRNRVIRGPYKNWCATCAKKAIHIRFDERRQKKVNKVATDNNDLEYKAAQLKAVGSALTPLGAITGWGQGDLKRLKAERRQKEQMDALLEEVKQLRRALKGE